MELEHFDFSGAGRPRLNVAGLKKGDYIPPDEIEKAVDAKRGTPEYGLKLLALREDIIKQSGDNGYQLVAKGENHGLRILDNEECQEYTLNLQRLRLRSHGNWNRIARDAVDVSKLQDHTRGKFEREMEMHARIIQHHAREMRNLLREQGADDGQTASSAG